MYVFFIAVVAPRFVVVSKGLIYHLVRNRGAVDVLSGLRSDRAVFDDVVEKKHCL